MDIISDCRRVLEAKLPDNSEALKSALQASMRLREPLLKARVAAQQDLANKRFRYRRPKDLKEYTDWDRNIMLEGDVSEVNATYETLVGLEALLKERIDILRLLLSLV